MEFYNDLRKCILTNVIKILVDEKGLMKLAHAIKKTYLTFQIIF